MPELGSGQNETVECSGEMPELQEKSPPLFSGRVYLTSFT